MKCKNLINIVDKFNEHNIIASLTLNPEKILFIYEKYDEQFKEFEKVRKYLEDKLPNAAITGALADKVNSERISEIISQYNSKDTILNISGGNKIMSLIAYEAAKICKIQSIFVDVDDEKAFSISDNGIQELAIRLRKLGVKDFINSTGGEIIHDSTSLVNNEKTQEYVNYIISNLDIWDDLKKALKDPNIVIHDKSALDTITFNLGSVDEYHVERYKGFFYKLEELGLTHTSYINPYELNIKFKVLEAKTILFKTGTWLEILVYTLIKQIKHVRDVKSGVVFLWDDDIRYVKNEIDVIAAANSQLIYVSCKDTDKYDENTLNELQVYASQLGGDEVKKILVATKESEKRSLRLRAEEMGIHLIIFSGNIEELRGTLSQVIR